MYIYLLTQNSSCPFLSVHRGCINSNMYQIYLVSVLRKWMYKKSSIELLFIYWVLLREVTVVSHKLHVPITFYMNKRCVCYSYVVIGGCPICSDGDEGWKLSVDRPVPACPNFSVLDSALITSGKLEDMFNQAKVLGCKKIWGKSGQWRWNLENEISWLFPTLLNKIFGVPETCYFTVQNAMKSC